MQDIDDYYMMQMQELEEEGEEKLSDEDKAIAEKAAKLIARDYGETLRELADE